MKTSLLVQNVGSEEEPSCRYCLESTGELIAPCKCDGSSKWVHSECLEEWRQTVLNRIMIPFRPNQYDAAFRCEICHGQYTLKDEHRSDCDYRAWGLIARDLLILTVVLQGLYFGLGFAIPTIPSFITTHVSGHMSQIYLNGMFWTHVILGALYLLTALVLAFSEGGGGGCCFCYYGGGSNDCDCGDEGCLIIAIILILLSIVITFLLVYFEIFQKRLQKNTASQEVSARRGTYQALPSAPPQ